MLSVMKSPLQPPSCFPFQNKISKMRIIFMAMVASCCFFTTSVSALTPCINKEYCNCESSLRNISCACANSNGSAINIQGYHVPQPVSLLSVVDCKELTLGRNIYQLGKAEVTLLRDIRRLTMNSSTFRSINKDVKKLRFENTRIQTLLEKTFFRIENVDSIEFVDVSVLGIQPYAFCDLANIRSITFVNSYLGDIWDKAFHNVSGLEKLSIINCSIYVLNPKAINIENTTLVSLLNVSIKYMRERSIQLNDVSNFEMNDCHVHVMYEEAVKVVKAENGNVSFSRNTVQSLLDGAWRGIVSASHVTLVDNRFQGLRENSLDSLFQLEHLTMMNNSFYCSQGLCPSLQMAVWSNGGWQLPALEDSRCNNEPLSLRQFYTDDCPQMPPVDRQRSLDEVTSKARSAVDRHSAPAMSTGSDVYTCPHFLAIVLTLVTFKTTGQLYFL